MLLLSAIGQIYDSDISSVFKMVDDLDYQIKSLTLADQSLNHFKHLEQTISNQQNEIQRLSKTVENNSNQIFKVTQSLRVHKRQIFKIENGCLFVPEHQAEVKSKCRTELIPKLLIEFNDI